MKRKGLGILFGITLSVLLITAVIAPSARAAYPEKSVEIVVHTKAGGGSDIFARTVAEVLREEGLVKESTVANKPGGMGSVSMNYLASKKGNPYVIMTAGGSPIGSFLEKSPPVKFEDVTLLASLMIDPNMVFTRAESPYKDMKSLVEAARKNPNKIVAASGQSGSNAHIIIHRIERAAGVKFKLVHYASGSEEVLAVLGGHADLAVGNLEETLGQLEAKKVMALGVCTEKRISYVPDIPTMKEQGVDVVFNQIRGFWGPPDFPDYAVKFWRDAFAKLIKNKKFEKYRVSTCGELYFKTGDDFKKMLSDYLVVLKQDLDELGLLNQK